MILSCEGLFLATVQSTDTVSYRLLPKTGGDDKGKGSVPGGIGRLLDGNKRYR